MSRKIAIEGAPDYPPKPPEIWKPAHELPKAIDFVPGEIKDMTISVERSVVDLDILSSLIGRHFPSVLALVTELAEMGADLPTPTQDPILEDFERPGPKP
jgi:hypothetical protein